MNVSVVVPTYNRPEALWLCLTSLAQQSRLPEEVLVADDGSGEETRRTVKSFSQSTGCRFELKHIWQEDDGFRKPKIINETVRNATGDYLIFIDGDCMAHPDFVKSHLLSAEPNVMLGGKRVEVGKALSEYALQKRQLVNRLSIRLLMDSFSHNSRKVEEAIRIKSPLLRNLLHKDLINDDGIWGCNFSVYKDLFYAINGCDEDFRDGSVEDNDLGIRVLNSGGKLKSVRSLAIVFHLWHKASWNTQNEIYQHNIRILENRKLLRQPRCRNGISQP